MSPTHTSSSWSAAPPPHSRLPSTPPPKALPSCSQPLCRPLLRKKSTAWRDSTVLQPHGGGGGDPSGIAAALQACVRLPLACVGQFRWLAWTSSGGAVLLCSQVLDEADTMFDRGFGPEMGRIVAPLRRRSASPELQKRPSPQATHPQQAPQGQGAAADSFQTVLVTATISKVCPDEPRLPALLGGSLCSPLPL